jgi:integrase
MSGRHYQHERRNLNARFPGYRFGLHRGVWRVRWKEPGQGADRALSLRTADAGEAAALFTEYLNAKARLAQPAGPAIGALFTDYQDRLNRDAARPDRAATAWKALAPHFAHCRPAQVTELSCRAYAAGRTQAGVRPATIAKELEILRAALRHAARKKLTDQKAEFWFPPVPERPHRHLTREEASRLEAACKSPHVKLFIILALTTAGRREALLSLTWDRVDFANRRIDLAAPGASSRRKNRATVPMNPRAEAALREAQACAASTHVIEYAGARIRSIRTAFREAVLAAGVAPCTPHTLRHTAAVWMAQQRVPMSEIARYLGHTDSRITERTYARYSPDYLQGAAGALDW